MTTNDDAMLAITRLEGKLEAMTVQMSANNIASVERDTRIEERVKGINGSVARHEERLAILWTDRSIWNWVLRFFVIATPITLGLVNYFTR